MALPKIDLPRYRHTLVGLGKEVSYRPFTLREQKLLLLAKETEEFSQQLESIKQIIELCTFNQVNPSELAFFDIEDLFLRIRSKSVGEICEIMYRDKINDKKYKVSINLNDVQVVIPEEHTNTIMISETMGIKMKYPTIEMINSKASADDISEDEIITQCIDCVFNEEEVFYFKDYTQKEVEEWVEDLDSNVLMKIQQFFTSMPRLRHEVEMKLDDDRTETLRFEGIESFFI